MKEVVVVTDVGNRPMRVQALRDAHSNVVAVCPDPFAWKHCDRFAVPPEWLSADPAVPLKKKCWLRSAWVGLAAVRELRIEADFYWFIESDCAAPQELWKSMFALHRGNPADCLSHPVREKHQLPANPWWRNAGTPGWCQTLFIMACYRLSRRAVEEATRCAVETRECFSEVALPSVIRRAGMTLEPVNQQGRTFWNAATFRTHEDRVIVNPHLLCHPLKKDSRGVSD